ncbi:MAG: hypothetical protein KTU85_03745 [Acidimicrobiia bacterium]|nr:hypothetical protein [Acidimicrobiia bacterium]MCY4458353.1 hypothetical protein [Acidimicrobiaceae bacterium]
MLASVSDRDVLEVTGADATAYLQGQISQDVTTITEGSSAWSLVLAPHGKLNAWFRLHRVSDEKFFIDLEAGWAQRLADRLQRFKLRSAVELQMLEGWRMISLRQDGSTDSSSPQTQPPQTKLCAEFSWPGFSGTDFLGYAIEAPPNIAVDNTALEQARILAGVPRLGQDINENTIPAEAGAYFISQSVSFTKGCYTGQELVARIDSRGGNVPRPLRLLIAQQSLSVGATVSYQGSAVGRVTSAASAATAPSAAQSFALATVMRKVQPGATVTVEGVSARLGALN